MLLESSRERGRGRRILDEKKRGNTQNFDANRVHDLIAGTGGGGSRLKSGFKLMFISGAEPSRIPPYINGKKPHFEISVKLRVSFISMSTHLKQTKFFDPI
jgi:hypothetical protein